MSEDIKSWLLNKNKLTIHNMVISNCDCKSLLENIKGLLYPGYIDCVNYVPSYIDCKLASIKNILYVLFETIEKIENITIDKDNSINSFINELPVLEDMLNKDIEAIYNGDPAAKSKAEIIICYPGFKAIFTYRVAHILYKLNIPILPRYLTELAHSLTGIDIHPGATIGNYFFIDHGTGIVIGETTIIGNNVKIYQGVTLGALSLSKGNKLKGTKRHPTICDNVTIYSGASIFGGDTIIGSNTTIGSNAFITESVDENMIVTLDKQIKKLK